jgi:iron complex transport system ATP-binding protein
VRLEIGGVCVDIEGTSIVQDASLVVETGEIAGLVGPNGSGKSTLLRAIYRHLRPVAGLVTVGGEDVWRSSPAQAARRTAALPQERPTEFDMTVREIVFMGRTPHKRPFAVDTAEDVAIVDEALRSVRLAPLADRRFSSLSGGEKQRALVARAIAQRSRVLVLDEPTNHLDVRYALELMELVRELGLTTIAALHDLNLAAAYCQRVHVLDGGRLVAGGPPADVLTAPLLRAVFGVDADITTNPGTGRLSLAFSPLPHTGRVAEQANRSGIGSPGSRH